MAYFECIIGSRVGLNIPLIVTCSSGFAGLTITCTDGTTTLTDTCPSTSPYEVTFNLPNTGTWTVSSIVSGTTYSESILVEDFDVELKNNIDLTVDFYSAANDTVSYTSPIDSTSHTITTDSNGHATATITIEPNGNSITFTSSVAKNPNSLSSYYSKTIALSSSTTEIKVMPDNTVYWYGYSSNCEDLTTNNGWNEVGYPFYNPQHNTNSVYLSCNGQGVASCGIGSSVTQSSGTRHAIILKSESSGNGYLSVNNSKARWGNNTEYKQVACSTSNNLQHMTLADSLSSYVFYTSTGANSTIYALWSD